MPIYRATASRPPSSGATRAGKSKSIRRCDCATWKSPARAGLQDGFEVALGTGRRVRCRKLLIATGLFDFVPRIPGFAECFGRTVFQCPYCDGWELRDQPLAIYGRRQRGFEMARALTAWSRDLMLFTDGPSRYSRRAVTRPRTQWHRADRKARRRARSERRRLKAVRCADGERVPRRALFFDTPSSGQSRLAESLGCRSAGTAAC